MSADDDAMTATSLQSVSHSCSLLLLLLLLESVEVHIIFCSRRRAPLLGQHCRLLAELLVGHILCLFDRQLDVKL